MWRWWFLWAGLCAAGCAGTGGGGDAALRPPPEERATALLTHEHLAQLVEIQDQGYSYDESAVFLGETLIYNKSAQPLPLEVRTLFKDAENRTLATTPWKALKLAPGERYIYVAPSPFKTTYKFMVQLRDPRVP
jgi:hypothetical protein